MPRNHAPRATTLHSVQRVGANIFVRMGAINEEEIDAPVIGRIIKGGAVTKQGLYLPRDVHAFPDVSLHIVMLFNVETIDRRRRESEFAVGRQIKGVNARVIVAVEGHVCRRIPGQGANLKDDLRSDRLTEEAQTDDVGDVRRRPPEPRLPIVAEVDFGEMRLWKHLKHILLRDAALVRDALEREQVFRGVRDHLARLVEKQQAA